MGQQSIIEAINASPLNRGRDGAEWLADDRNIALIYDGDIALFDFEDPGVYQMHVLFKSRGRAAIERACQAITEIFNWTVTVDTIMALAPAFRRDVKLLARWCGFRSAGMRATVYGPCELFVLPRNLWKGEQ